MFSMIFASPEHRRSGEPRNLVPAGEQGDPPAGGQRPLQLDGPPDVAGVALAARLLDIGSDRVELASQFLDVLGGEVRVLLDVGDSHVSPRC